MGGQPFEDLTFPENCGHNRGTNQTALDELKEIQVMPLYQVEVHVIHEVYVVERSAKEAMITGEELGLDSFTEERTEATYARELKSRADISANKMGYAIDWMPDMDDEPETVGEWLEQVEALAKRREDQEYIERTQTKLPLEEGSA